MLTNPIGPVVELWLAIYNCLPIAFQAFFNLILALMATSAVVSLIWRLNG